ncbi:hypothetical protein DNI29_19050 [Hymenobacter sediminis]|uniref:3'-5' exonuclease n=1 Tax=Hymenobacter sediminis TaxID=2218621 RepID=UPI000DA6A744|nr:3'-5' exonuclease [Hymenobacter sediminis]RPD45480.1 hypothetical protein DNI29_19050 [Hymenobacter sediminis]
MASYFKLRTGLSRSKCHEKWEYFCEDATGISVVHEYANGFLYMSAAPSKQLRAKFPNALLQVPLAAVPCSADEYAAVHARYTEAEAKRKAEEELLKALRKGMSRNQHAAEEAGVAEPARLAPHLLDDFTVFDTETTGLSPENDRILEVAAVRYINWEPVAQMQQFVRFTGRVPHFITKLTGIADQDVRHASESKTVLGQFRKLAGESLLVGHNVGFDIRMIEAERKRLGAVVALPNPVLCTMELAKQRTPAPHKLGKLCERFSIPVVGAHRAMNDVLMTYELLRYLHELEPVTQLSPLKPVVPAAAAQSSLFAAA